MSVVKALSQKFDRGEWMRLGVLYGIIAFLHLLGWGMLLLEAPRFPALLGLGALAYSFGMRHAFDADHISAIDNITRKLLQQGQKPMGTGFFFSLGHSTVVFVIALALGFAVKTLVESVVDQNGELHRLGGLVGVAASGFFLVLIGIVNLIILLDILATYRRMKQGHYDRQTLEAHLITGGVLVRVFKGLFRLVTASWHMYPIGFLFGLGFDTASEVALLAISAGAAAQGLPFSAIVALPVIFAAGMCVMDTTDGIFMTKAYSWAFSSPVRKLFYNMTMTGLSVFVALFVGGVEVAQLLIELLGLKGGAFDLLAGLNFGDMGFVIVGAFIVAWIVAFALFKTQRVEERWEKYIRSASE